MFKLFFVFLFLISFNLSSISQEIGYDKVHFWWKKYKVYDNDSNLQSIDKVKRLFLIDLSTLRTKCYLRVRKEYVNNKCTNRMYSTIIEGGCLYFMHLERDYDKRFPNFFIFRIKVLFPGNIGFKQLLYKHNRSG